MSGNVNAGGTDTGGGIGGTGITGVGIVQKFGSIFVNGREFFLDDATRVTREDTPAGAGDLRLGDVVVVQGVIERGSGRSIATGIQARLCVRGIVQEVDATAGTLRVLGQTVRVGAVTRGDGDATFSLGRIKAGDWVAVSGLARADGSWVASRIDRSVTSRSFVVRGRLDGLGREGNTIAVGGQTFVFQAGAAAGDLRRGETIRLSGDYDDRGQPRVSAIRAEGLLAAPPGRLVEMSGYVQAAPAPGEARSNDVTLRYSGGTVFVNGTPADIRADAPVAVRGELGRDGSIVAREIVLDVDPRDVVLPAADVQRGESAVEDGRHNRPERERSEFEKPEIERPEVEKPEVEMPTLERPEPPEMRH